MKVLAAAVIIAVLGIAAGGFFALRAPSATTTTETITSPTTITAVSTAVSTATGAMTTITQAAPPSTVTSTITSVASASTVTVTSSTVNTVTATGSVSPIALSNKESEPEGLTYDSANNDIYVALQNISSVAVISAATNAVVTTIALPTGDEPIATAYDSVNGNVYVANENSGCPVTIADCTIQVINTATNTLATPLAVTDTTNAVAVNPTTNTVAVASNDLDGMYFVNGATGAVSELQNHTTLPDNAQSLAFDTAKNLLFVGNSYGKRTQAQLGFVGPEATSTCLWKNTNTTYCFTKTIGIDGSATAGTAIDGIGVNPTTGYVYLANYKANLVNVISETTGADVANITVTSPYSLAVDTTSNLIYVTSTSTNSLVVISGSTNAIVGTVPVGNGPSWVMIDPTNDAVYVSNATADTPSISVILNIRQLV
jgi:DNA-binding beta-propeller fold protein YncE